MKFAGRTLGRRVWTTLCRLGDSACSVVKASLIQRERKTSRGASLTRTGCLT